MVVGGNSLLSGFTERLNRDLSHRTPPVSDPLVLTIEGHGGGGVPCMEGNIPPSPHCSRCDRVVCTRRGGGGGGVFSQVMSGDVR